MLLVFSYSSLLSLERPPAGCRFFVLGIFKIRAYRAPSRRAWTFFRIHFRSIGLLFNYRSCNVHCTCVGVTFFKIYGQINITLLLTLYWLCLQYILTTFDYWLAGHLVWPPATRSMMAAWYAAALLNNRAVMLEGCAPIGRGQHCSARTLRTKPG
jgi:hypothetical protein